MPDELSFSSQEFMNSFIDDLKKSYDELEKMEKDSGQVDAIVLLQLINSFLEVLKQIVTIEGRQLKYNTDDLVVSDKNQAFLQLMTFGAQLVYRIRTLLLKEDIDYYIGGQDPSGKQLYQKHIPQSTILPALKANLSSGAVLLDAEIEKIENLDKVASHINFLWQQIQYLSDVSSFDNKSSAKDITLYSYTFVNKSGKNINVYRHYYQKPSDDTRVFIRYQNQKTKKNKLSYYDINGRMSFFNQGWLYEWFSEYLNQEHGYTTLFSSLIEDKSLSVMMKQTDTVAGYKGGDFTIGKQQIQAKFGNLRVISFKSIVTVLTSLQDGLQAYVIAVSEENKDKAIAQIAQIFAADNIEQLNKASTQVILNNVRDTLKIDFH